MKHDDETDRIIRELAARLRRSSRAEAREIGEAVESGTYSFGEIAASSAYADFLAESFQKLEGLTPEDFANDTENAEPADRKSAVPERPAGEAPGASLAARAAGGRGFGGGIGARSPR